MTTTLRILHELTTSPPMAHEAACGCLTADGRLYPCRTCRAEMDAELAGLYATVAEDWGTVATK